VLKGSMERIHQWRGSQTSCFTWAMQSGPVWQVRAGRWRWWSVTNNAIRR
jgi:hypothetical protein